jgi:predicted O-linked N-acetylglucosamine transferase (SPINDLY family)
VVTLAGDRHVSRVSASLLNAIGRPDWIARDASGYVRIAVELAGAGRRTPEKCHVLRDTLRKSPLLDGAGQAARFAAAVHECWAAVTCARAVAM